jgi:hypothetical protein
MNRTFGWATLTVLLAALALGCSGSSQLPTPTAKMEPPKGMPGGAPTRR